MCATPPVVSAYVGGGGGGGKTGLLRLIFGQDNPQEIALAFLQGDLYDKELTARKAGQELAGLLHKTFEVELDHALTYTAWREKLARHLLQTELLDHLGDTRPGPMCISNDHSILPHLLS